MPSCPAPRRGGAELGVRGCRLGELGGVPNVQAELPGTRQDRFCRDVSGPVTPGVGSGTFGLK